MSYEKVAVDAILLGLAERDQVLRIKLEIRMQMKRSDVMDFKVLGAPTDFADRMQFEVVGTDLRPVSRARSTDRMLAFGSIDEMANDGHKKARFARA